MLKLLRLTAAPCVALLALIAGCSSKQPQATSPSPTPTSSLSTEPAPSPITSAAPSLQTNQFQDASDKAIGAENISESAQSKNDWDLVVGMWQEAIALMKAVPTSSPSYALAQKKAKEYQQNLAYAKQQSVEPATIPELTVVEEPLDTIIDAPAKASAPITVASPSPKTSSSKSTIKISGRQYVVTNTGPQPVADNRIAFMPCAPINSDCQTLRAALANSIVNLVTVQQKISNCHKLGLPTFCMAETSRLLDEHMPLVDKMSNLRSSMLKKKGHNSVKTDFDGKFSFDCPTQTCFIYSSSEVENQTYYWLGVFTPGETSNLSESNALKAPEL